MGKNRLFKKSRDISSLLILSALLAIFFNTNQAKAQCSNAVLNPAFSAHYIDAQNPPLYNWNTSGTVTEFFEAAYLNLYANTTENKIFQTVNNFTIDNGDSISIHFFFSIEKEEQGTLHVKWDNDTI